MKLIFLFFIFSTTWANDCYKSLCKGDIVKSDFGWKGQITRFLPHDDLVKIKFFLLSSEEYFTYETISKRVQCLDKFCTGEQVEGPRHNKLKIFELYSDETVYVHDPRIDLIYPVSIDEIQKINFP